LRLRYHIAWTSVALGCGCGFDTSEPVTGAPNPIVHGIDDRAEYHAFTDADVREMAAASAVALIENRFVVGARTGLIDDIPTWAAVENVCPEEPFSDQPRAAFCSGVLVDWDLVLTAGHCVRLFGLADFSVAFGYYFVALGELDVKMGDIVEPVEIVSERLDPEGAEPRLDYAVLRLARPVVGRRPALIQRLKPPSPGDAVVTMGSPHGVPLKLDAGGRVTNVRDARDYFLATTDTSAGWSGGGAFDESLGLVGILARGAEDLELSEAGCYASVHLAPTAAATEVFTSAARALEVLCEERPEVSSLCRRDCEHPCSPLRPNGEGEAQFSGCTIAVPESTTRMDWLALVAVILSLAGLGRRWSLGSCSRPGIRSPSRSGTARPTPRCVFGALGAVFVASRDISPRRHDGRGDST
jgi:hypothetical protein